LKGKGEERGGGRQGGRSWRVAWLYSS